MEQSLGGQSEEHSPAITANDIGKTKGEEGNGVNIVEVEEEQERQGVKADNDEDNIIPPEILVPSLSIEEQLSDTPLRKRLWELFLTFFPIGIYAVGGYTAQIAIFYNLLVRNRRWFDEREFKEFLAISCLCPGSVSTEFALMIGAYRAGAPGAIVSVVSFVLPGFVIYTLAGLGYILENPRKQTPWTEGFMPATAILVIIMAFRLGHGLIDRGEKMFILAITACVGILIETDPRVPITFLYWILPMQLIVGGIIMMICNLIHVRHLRLKEISVLKEIRSERRRLHKLQREFFFSVCVPSQAALALETVPMQDDSNFASSSPEQVEGQEQEQQLPSPPPPVLEQINTCSTIIEAKMGEAQIIHQQLEESLDQQAHVFHISTGLRMCLACLLFGFLVALGIIKTQKKGRLEGNMSLRLLSVFFFHSFKINGGPSELLPMMAKMVKEADLPLSNDDILDSFDLTLMLPGPPFNVAAYLGAKSLGTFQGALLGWSALMLPSLSLLLVILPVWSRIRKLEGAPGFMGGVGSAAMGIILAFPRLDSIAKASDAVIAVLVYILVGYLNVRGVFGILTGSLAGFLMSPMCLNIGQNPYKYTVHRET